MTRRASRPAGPPPFQQPRRKRIAAGLLPRVQHDGDTWWLLTLRSDAVSNGGTWANVGGSLNRDEDPLTGAVREFHEELGLSALALQGGLVGKVVETANERIDYTLFVLDLPGFLPLALLGWENDDVAWFTTDAVDDLTLHPAFAEQWAALR